jgi:hypothetical protein
VDNLTQLSELKHGSYYWVLFYGYKKPTPCFFYKDDDDLEDSCFLPGGMGDASSNGVYLDDIVKIGPEIIVPQL